MLNNYIWQTYLNAGGKTVVDIFEKNLAGNFSKEYAYAINTFHSAYCPSEVILQIVKNELLDLFNDLKDGITLLEEGEYTIESAMSSLYAMLQGSEHIPPQRAFDYFSGSLAYITTLLCTTLPTLFIPYYFLCNFNVLNQIAQEFEIELPPIPNKKDFKGRFYYYGEICAALLDFRVTHGMSPYELCAFIYDFAPKYIGGIDSYILKTLPEPKGAFFIGGSKNDTFRSEDPATIIPWQCNSDTRAGDMIVMYLKTPISAVDSLWRSVSVGFHDPFFYYYRCTYIANPIGVKRISLKQLQQDKIFKDIPIVRKNMQGINGVELKPSEYNHLVNITEANVPKLEFIVSNGHQEFTNEKDVENKLIKPLITKLGYSDNEYVQQLYIEIGNHNHALIPDFVLLPITRKGHPSAFAIIEAKLSITSEKKLEEVKNQARSYARQLNANYSVIISKDKIWVTVLDDDFTNDIFVSTWAMLNQADTFSKLFQLIGKKTK